MIKRLFKSVVRHKNKFLITSIALFFVIVGLVSHYIWSLFFAPNTNFEDDYIEIFIPTGSDYATVKSQISSHLRHIEDFDRVAFWYDYPEHIRAGRFVLKKKMSNRHIVSTLSYFNKPVRVTFNNMQTIYELAGKVAHHIEPDSTDIVEAVLDENFLEKNRFNQDNVLGMFIPNTYEFFWNTSAEEFRNRMLSEYKKFWNRNRLQKLDTLGFTKIEVITLASMVQKESLKRDELRRIAGVYINRIKKNVILQSCPTVIYAMKKQRKDFSLKIRRLLFKDLKIKSPYNTYVNEGLPPGPIVTPDIHVIDAVLNYEHHDYMYFLSDHDNPGYNKFSETLEKHNYKKRKYLAWLNKNGIKR